jgi:hypothetical protein
MTLVAAAWFVLQELLGRNSGAIYLAMTVGMFFNPALRQMDAGTARLA